MTSFLSILPIDLRQLSQFVQPSFEPVLGERYLDTAVRNWLINEAFKGCELFEKYMSAGSEVQGIFCHFYRCRQFNESVIKTYYLNGIPTSMQMVSAVC